MAQLLPPEKYRFEDVEGPIGFFSPYESRDIFFQDEKA
jgi:hypothetical protein